MKGIVKWFNDSKGIGFITGTDGKDYFVHYTGIYCDGFKTLAQDRAVEFEPLETERGLQCTNVKYVKETL